MTEADRNWCMDTAILEVERDCDSKDYLVVLSRNALSSDRPAAYILPKILHLDPSNERVLLAVAKALTHTSDEVSLWCADGIRPLATSNWRGRTGSHKMKSRHWGEPVANIHLSE